MPSTPTNQGLTPYLPVYRRADVVMVRGEGAYLYDADGNCYLDFAAGIAVNSLGHAHPKMVAALKAQAELLWHCSNNYQNEPLLRYSQALMARSPLDSAFFCSSGVEAIEAGIKFIRRYHYGKQTGRSRIITFEGAFHGRSIAAISAGGNGHFREGYAPYLEGFDRAVFNDLSSVEAAITPQTAAIMLEPVQGEGGIYPASAEFIQGLRRLCDTHGILLFLDEVQCGFGRLGTLFAHEYFGVVPDIIAMAKGIGGGFPLGATLVSAEVATQLPPGSHGSTYGSNPLAMAVGEAVLAEIADASFLKHVGEMGVLLQQRLSELSAEFPQRIKAVRGIGLMIGIEIAGGARDFATKLRANGLLLAPSFSEVLRVLPPLIIEPSHIDAAMAVLRQTLEGETK